MIKNDLVNNGSIKNLIKTLTATVIAISLGCSKEEPPTGYKDLGTQAKFEDVEHAFSSALNDATIRTAKVGQYVKYELNYRVDLGEVVKQGAISRELIGVQDSPTKTTYSLEQIYEELEPSGAVAETQVSEVNLVDEKMAPTTAIKQAMNEISIASTAASSDCGNPGVTPDGKRYDCTKYYNFSTSPVNEPVPELTAQRPNCGNIPGCVIPSRLIQFDIVKFNEGKIVSKQTYRFSLSKTVPALFPEDGYNIFAMNYLCISSLYNGTQYYVNQCTVLRDIQL